MTTGPSLSWQAPLWMTGMRVLSRWLRYWGSRGWPLLPARYPTWSQREKGAGFKKVLYVWCQEPRESRALT